MSRGSLLRRNYCKLYVLNSELAEFCSQLFFYMAEWKGTSKQHSEMSDEELRQQGLLLLLLSSPPTYNFFHLLLCVMEKQSAKLKVKMKRLQTSNKY